MATQAMVTISRVAATGVTADSLVHNVPALLRIAEHEAHLLGPAATRAAADSTVVRVKTGGEFLGHCRGVTHMVIPSSRHA